MSQPQSVTGREIFLEREKLIVSKTDTNGKITYCNSELTRISGYRAEELIGRPHSIFRHPWMPRSLFKHMWTGIQGGGEVFAYIVNRCKNGDHYWVFAHITPSWSDDGRIIGFHSNRRAVDPDVISRTIAPLYRDLCAAEQTHQSRREGLLAGEETLTSFLRQRGRHYDDFIFDVSASIFEYLQ